MKVDLDDPSVVETIAKSLTESEKKRHLAAVAAIEFDCSTFETASAMLCEAGRRETVIVGWALISFCLDFAVRQNLQHGSKKDREELLDGLGPLSSDAAKLKLAKALGWLSPEIFEATNCVRKLRNTVAHQIVRNEDVDGFKSLPLLFKQQVEAVLEGMRAHAEKKLGKVVPPLPIDDTAKMKCAVVMLASHVLGSIIFGPARIQMGVKGGAVFFERDEGPQWWQDSTKASARATVVVIRAAVQANTEKNET